MVHFGVHVLAGSLIFVLISLPAYGLGLLVQYLAQNGAASYVIQVLTVLEYAIVTLDALVLLTYLVYTRPRSKSKCNNFLKEIVYAKNLPSPPT